MSTRLLLAGIGALCLIRPTTAADWPQFRNANCRSVADGTDYPLQWSQQENLRWRVPLPQPANSSPIVSNGKVFVTTGGEQGRRRSLLCFDRTDGAMLWTRTVEVTVNEPTHKTNPYSASTPAADGERVVVWHGSGGVYCYDFEGDELWKRDLGEFIHIWGYAGSPVFYESLILLNCGPGERTFLIALDKVTGRTVWQVDEPGGDSGEPTAPDQQRGKWVGSWSTPVLAEVQGSPQALVSFPHHVKAFDPRSGKLLWQCDGLGDLVYTSVVLGEDIAVSMSGFHGPAIGFRLVAENPEPSANLLWREAQRIPQRIGSGVIVDGVLYMANADIGTAQAIDAATGKELWRERMPEPAACWGSIVQAGDRLYVTNQNGATVVFRPNPERLEVLAVNALDEHTNSTPAFSDGELFLRTYKALYCIQQQ